MPSANPPSPVPVITLTKHHGLGNDFLVALQPPRPLGSGDARRWCHRREGIGADGLIEAVPVGPSEPSPSAPPSGPAPPPTPTGGRAPTRWRMNLWNSDGGRAEISGNGLRCLAQALADRLGHHRGHELELTIETDAGTRPATVLRRSGPTGGPAAVDQVRVAMGKAVEGPAPSSRWTEAGARIVDQLGVDLGNPHLVGFATDLDHVDMSAVGPVVEADHPGGLNVHVVRVVDRTSIEMLIWERGSGLTMACGSGACAAAWAAHRAGLVDDHVAVTMPGGAALVDLADHHIVLTGPAARVGEVRLDG